MLSFLRCSLVVVLAKISGMSEQLHLQSRLIQFLVESQQAVEPAGTGAAVSPVGAGTLQAVEVTSTFDRCEKGFRK